MENWRAELTAEGQTMGQNPMGYLSERRSFTTAICYSNDATEFMKRRGELQIY